MMELTPRSHPVDPPCVPNPRPRGPSEAQQQADAAVAAARGAVRKPLFKPPPPQPAPSRDATDIRLAEELDYIRRMLDAMGDRLADDPIILQRHAQTMQGFDLIGQMLGHVAKVVGTADRKAAIELVMPDMRARLQRRSLFGPA